MPEVSTPLKYHGGKAPIADWIVSHFPSHSNYVEPFAGGLSVMLAKDPEGVSEVANDLNKSLTNFWRVLQDDKAFGLLQRKLEATPFSEWEWKQATRRLLLDEIDVDAVHAFFVQCRQSLAGRMKSFASVSTSRRRRGMNEQVSAWLTAIEGLPAVHQRLKRVLVLNRDANDVIVQFDKPDTVIYCDSPYYPDTRASPDVYEFEMTAQQHEQYLETLLAVRHAFVAVSGYDCPLYAEKLKGWRRVQKEVANHSAGGKEKRKMLETLWLRE